MTDTSYECKSFNSRVLRVLEMWSLPPNQSAGIRTSIKECSRRLEADIASSTVFVLTAEDDGKKAYVALGSEIKSSSLYNGCPGIYHDNLFM